MPSLYDPAALEAFRRARRIEPERLRRLRTAWFKRFAGRDAALEELAEEDREAFAAEIDCNPLRIESQHDSQLDGATKLLLRTASGYLVEAVLLRIATGRTTLCVSSQVGCAAHCDFCATGKMGIAKNLSAAEILDQVRHAGELARQEGRTLRNLVFMGMGEPLHNEAELYQALDMLHSTAYFDRSPQRTLISTVGIPDAMVRMSQKFPLVNLALSLHSARQAEREKLIPLAVRHPLDELRAALVAVSTEGGRKVMIEYLLLDGVNDTDEDLAALQGYLTGLNVHLNLIPYNPIEGAPHLTGTPPERREAFAAALKAMGFATTIRYSLGADIAAACGQLVRQENRQIARRAARQ